MVQTGLTDGVGGMEWWSRCDALLLHEIVESVTETLLLPAFFGGCLLWSATCMGGVWVLLYQSWIDW
jgi:hypothetical protein